MSGGRSLDLAKQTKGSQSSLDQLEQDSKVGAGRVSYRMCSFRERVCVIGMFKQLVVYKDQEKGEKELIHQDEMSSKVWVCTSTHSSTKVMVLDATQPSDLLDSFYACNTHVVCIASVPGRFAGSSRLPSVIQNCTVSSVLTFSFPSRCVGL